MTTAPRALQRRPRPRERSVQQQIVHTLRVLGATVYVSGTTRRKGDFQGTMQTPGIPDLEAFLPGRGPHPPCLLKIEVKAVGGRLRPEQAQYREHCLRAGVAHVVGGLDDVLAWLIREGYIREDQVPHYRGSALPVTGTEG